jgi:hypothetical protein
MDSDALCSSDPTLHDADPGQRSWLPTQVAYAAAICRVCPLLDPCRRYAADMDTRNVPVYGVVAGKYRPWPGAHAYASPCHGCRRLVVSRYYTRRYPDLLDKGYLTGTGGWCRTCWERQRKVAS